jgi:hypothetical protein
MYCHLVFPSRVAFLLIGLFMACESFGLRRISLEQPSAIFQSVKVNSMEETRALSRASCPARASVRPMTSPTRLLVRGVPKSPNPPLPCSLSKTSRRSAASSPSAASLGGSPRSSEPTASPSEPPWLELTPPSWTSGWWSKPWALGRPGTCRWTESISP